MAEQHKIWYMCKYTPLEIFAGFSCETERLESVMDSFETADSIAHPNICGYGKSLLEACTRPEVEEVVLVNCCDVARRVYDILKYRGNLKFLYLLDLPHKRGRAEKWLFESLLEKLVRTYEEYSGIRFDPALAYRETRRQSERFPEKAQESGPGFAPRGDEGQFPGTGDLPSGKYISLQGAHGGPHLLQMISGHFSVPVRDETCSGNRRLDPVKQPEDEKEFLHYYAGNLLGQIPCMRMADVTEREELGRGAAGIIYHTMKFCDYYGFDYADRVRPGRIPSLKIETDATGQSEGQLLTRLDAFAESLNLSVNQKKRANRTSSGGRVNVITTSPAGDGFPEIFRRAGGSQMVNQPNFVAGIDSGSASTDVVIMDRDRNIVSTSILRTGAGAARGAERALEDALTKAGLSREQISETVSTGYGRDTIGIGDTAVTEITCHAKGAFFLDPEIRTIIDIGGQDSKVIRVDETGAVVNFTMNDKCAAGTGRFLEMMARTLELSMDEMEKLGAEWKEDVTISSMCTVFAESEVVSLVARNTAVPDVIHGLNKAVAVKTASLVRRVGGREAYMMTGGVAKNAALVKELEKKLGADIRVSGYAQLCGAIGAALLALE